MSGSPPLLITRRLGANGPSPGGRVQNSVDFASLISPGLGEPLTRTQPGRARNARLLTGLQETIGCGAAHFDGHKAWLLFFSSLYLDGARDGCGSAVPVYGPVSREIRGRKGSKENTLFFLLLPSAPVNRRGPSHPLLPTQHALHSSLQVVELRTADLDGVTRHD